jgi:hypothetical protein
MQSWILFKRLIAYVSKGIPKLRFVMQMPLTNSFRNMFELEKIRRKRFLTGLGKITGLRSFFPQGESRQQKNSEHGCSGVTSTLLRYLIGSAWKFRCWLWGEHDTLVPVQPSVERIRAATNRAWYRDVTIMVIPRADHNLMRWPNPEYSGFAAEIREFSRRKPEIFAALKAIAKRERIISWWQYLHYYIIKASICGECWIDDYSEGRSDF